MSEAWKILFKEFLLSFGQAFIGAFLAEVASQILRKMPDIVEFLRLQMVKIYHTLTAGYDRDYPCLLPTV